MNKKIIMLSFLVVNAHADFCGLSKEGKAQGINLNLTHIPVMKVNKNSKESEANLAIKIREPEDQLKSQLPITNYENISGQVYEINDRAFMRIKVIPNKDYKDMTDSEKKDDGYRWVEYKKENAKFKFEKIIKDSEYIRIGNGMRLRATSRGDLHFERKNQTTEWTDLGELAVSQKSVQFFQVGNKKPSSTIQFLSKGEKDQFSSENTVNIDMNTYKGNDLICYRSPHSRSDLNTPNNSNAMK